jgi:hypothetical protein
MDQLAEWTNRCAEQQHEDIQKEETPGHAHGRMSDGYLISSDSTPRIKYI